jgi:hypothetical protein
MAKSVQSWGIPTKLSLEQFRQFVLPHLTVGRRGPGPKPESGRSSSGSIWSLTVSGNA